MLGCCCCCCIVCGDEGIGDGSGMLLPPGDPGVVGIGADAALRANSELGKVPPCGGGKFFLEMQTIKCIAMANSNRSNRLSTGRSTMFQMSRRVAVSTPDFENRATASCPYMYPSGLAYWGKSASYRARSCGVMTYGSCPTKARLSGVGGACCCCCCIAPR